MSQYQRIMPEISKGLLEYLALAQESLERLSGGKRSLGTYRPEDLWGAPFAMLSHDTSSPPRFVYSNLKALEAFETTWADWIGRPSRESAQEDEREAREKLLKDVEARGYSEGYRGIRISAKGRRFQIENAILWNVEKGGRRIGQAAIFDRWTPVGTQG